MAVGEYSSEFRGGCWISIQKLFYLWKIIILRKIRIFEQNNHPWLWLPIPLTSQPAWLFIKEIFKGESKANHLIIVKSYKKNTASLDLSSHWMKTAATASADKRSVLNVKESYLVVCFALSFSLSLFLRCTLIFLVTALSSKGSKVKAIILVYISLISTFQ